MRFECPTCSGAIEPPLRDGAVCACPPEAARIEHGVLSFGRGLGALVGNHEVNLEPSAVERRLAFDRRFAEYCDAAYSEFHAEPRQGRAALSLGCGLGFDVLELKRLGYDAVGVEVADMAKIWAERLGPDAWRCVVSADGRLPFPDGSLDLITCVNVFEHVGTVPPHEIVTPKTFPERTAFIRRAVEKLRDGGVLVLVVPNRAYPFDTGHYHHYDKDGWQPEQSFHVVDPLHPMNFLPSRPDLVRMCRDVSRTLPLSLYFLDDGYLMGELDLHARPEWKAHYSMAMSRWAAAHPEFPETAKDQHIQAVIVRGARTPRADLAGSYAVVWAPSPGQTWLGTWRRQALFRRYHAQWRNAESGAVEGDLLHVAEENGRVACFESRTTPCAFVVRNGSRGTLPDRIAPMSPGARWRARLSGARWSADPEGSILRAMDLDAAEPAKAVR